MLFFSYIIMKYWHSLVFSVFWGQIVSGQQVTEPERPPAAESQQESDAEVLKEQNIEIYNL